MKSFISFSLFMAIIVCLLIETFFINLLIVPMINAIHKPPIKTIIFFGIILFPA